MLWKKVFTSYSFKQHGGAFFISLFLSLFVFAPIIALYINVFIIFIRYLYMMLVIGNIIISGWIFLWTYFYLDTLIEAKEERYFDVKKTWLRLGTPKAMVVFIIGLALIIFVTPRIL